MGVVAVINRKVHGESPPGLEAIPRLERDHIFRVKRGAAGSRKHNGYPAGAVHASLIGPQVGFKHRRFANRPGNGRPEGLMAMRREQQLDTRLDLYAAGIVVFELGSQDEPETVANTRLLVLHEAAEARIVAPRWQEGCVMRA